MLVTVSYEVINKNKYIGRNLCLTLVIYQESLLICLNCYDVLAAWLTKAAMVSKIDHVFAIKRDIYLTA